MSKSLKESKIGARQRNSIIWSPGSGVSLSGAECSAVKTSRDDMKPEKQKWETNSLSRVYNQSFL